MPKGKSAPITGSLGGIGFAKALAGLGRNLMPKGFADADTITAFGVHAVLRNADPRDPVQIAALIEATAKTHGAPGILVNNAVVRYFDTVEDGSTQTGTKTWRSICRHNSNGGDFDGAGRRSNQRIVSQ